jgi:hypothetical protein
MRTIGAVLLLAGGMASMPSRALAQQKPIYGCNAAPSCRPLGFSSLNNNTGVSGVFFGVGMAWGPGFNIHIPGPHEITLVEKRAPEVDGDLFHLNARLLPPMSPSTPSPIPSPTAAAPARPPGG